jgi:hypothetical protein
LLREVLKKYPEAVMFNGHTHWEMNSVGNIFEGDSDLPIRIFNCASVSYLWTGYNVITGENLLGSQGYYVELYDGKMVVKGRDFSASKWISPAQYVLSFESTCKHTYKITEISYGNGFNAYGNLTYTCSLCQKETSSACKPMITPKGYSIGPNGNALLAGYDINSSYLKAYEDIHGTLSIGIAVANPSKFGDGEFLNADGKLNTEYGIQLEITTRDLARVTCSIDGYSDAQLDLDLVFVFYVIDGSNVHFVQANSPYASDCTIGTRSFLSVSLATVKANLPSQSDEE